MNPVPIETQTIDLDVLQPGVCLIDRHQKNEKVIRRVERHDSFVRLYFQSEDEPFTYSISELQSRFEVESGAFRADPHLVRLVAEAHRLRHAYLFNPIFSTETSLIDPLPHQFIAVYDHLLKHFPLRFLLADDAGAGKTIMTGLYIQEVLLRRQVERVLIVPPAGLIGNWERELRLLFRLRFRILSSADATVNNPFLDPQNHLAIVSLDTLRQERMQDYLFEAPPYDLIVFDEAHKLSARFESDGTVTKSKRYQLAEQIAAGGRSLLLLTATPHMGKNDAYYFLWRLLMPDLLAAQEAFNRLPESEKSKHILRRMKEEMITFEAKPIYPPRMSRTIAYPLKSGEISEQSLYDEVTDYCETYFDLAGQYNRAAAKMAMMVLQRRLASSTYALLHSLIRREEKLQTTLRDLAEGRLTVATLEQRQGELREIDIREEKTGDEEEIIDGREEAEQIDDDLAQATTARSIEDLEAEIQQVQSHTKLARAVYNLKAESKFERLWEALNAYPDEKVLIFTEHRDTMDFVIGRLEALGFTGNIAQIHGGMKYDAREKQVEFFRDLNGAKYLVATDAAGEGINLQFCRLMVNYDIPWNPARLEQRMGRIHRYKQTRTVVLLNLVAQDTREGRVLKVLLEKLEQMRQELNDDKVFDVVGQQFSGIALTKLIEQAITGNQTDASIQTINNQFTAESIKKQFETQQKLVACSEVRRLLDGVEKRRKAAETLRMMPAYVRSFFQDTAPFVGYEIDGDVKGLFKLLSCPPSVQIAIEKYPSHLREQLTFSKELALPAGSDKPQAIYLHPGEPIFESVLSLFLGEFDDEGYRGAVYTDSQTDEAYLFYLAGAPVLRQGDTEPRVLDEVLAGIKQYSDGRFEVTPAHLLLTLTINRVNNEGSTERIAMAISLTDTKTIAFPIRSLDHSPISREWIDLADDVEPVEGFVTEKLGNPKVSGIRDELQSQLENKKRQIQISINLRKGELLEQRRKLKDAVARAVPAAQTKLNDCERELGDLHTRRAALEASLIEEIQNTQLGPVTIYLRALVIPALHDETITQSTHDAETIALKTVIEYELEHGAEMKDVSNPSLKKGFDLESKRPSGEIRYIEVKGRTGVTNIELTANEWRQAENHQNRYWLYTVYHCESGSPKLYRCQNPHAKEIGKPEGGVIVNANDIISNCEE